MAESLRQTDYCAIFSHSLSERDNLDYSLRQYVANYAFFVRLVAYSNVSYWQAGIIHSMVLYGLVCCLHALFLSVLLAAMRWASGLVMTLDDRELDEYLGTRPINGRKKNGN